MIRQHIPYARRIARQSTPYALGIGFIIGMILLPGFTGNERIQSMVIINILFFIPFIGLFVLYGLYQSLRE